MGRRKGQYIPPDVAMNMIDDDMPDGAYFAMLGDLTGMDPAGAAEKAARVRQGEKREKCPKCGRGFATVHAVRDHLRDKHGEA